MARLAPVFQRIMDPASVAGPRVTAEELREAIRIASPAELRAFAAQALDSIADGEVVRLVADRIGADALPPPTNTLTSDPAARAVLEGRRTVKRADGDAEAKQAIRTIQRALIKIGAHHAQGQRLTDLLQLPWAADGDMGDTTARALNVALNLAGRVDLAQLTKDSVIGKPVAEAIERLLGETVQLIHPAVINAPAPRDVRKRVIFVGMGDHSKHEADAVRRALPAGWDLAYVGDSAMGDDVVKVPVGGRNTVFDLKETAGRQRFVETAFAPPLSANQQQKVLEALEARAWGMSDCRDELAMLALEMHAIDSSNGRRTLAMAYLSGHSAGGGIWGDHNGELPMESMKKIAEAFPNACASKSAPLLAACNHLHQRHVEEMGSIFTGMTQICGYSAYAPGTWVGGIAQCLAWAKLVAAGQETITPEMMHQELEGLRRSAGGNRNNPLFYANEKKFHIATWNKSDGLYRWFEKQGDAWIARTKEMRANPQEIAARKRALEVMVPEFDRMLKGEAGAPDLRGITPHGDNLAVRFYEAAGRLSGTMGLDEATTTFADAHKSMGLKARYYGNILTKLTETSAAVIDAGNRELTAAGFAPWTGAKIRGADTSRRALVDYVRSMGAQVERQRAAGQPSERAAALFRELNTRAIQLDQIPSSWL